MHELGRVLGILGLAPKQCNANGMPCRFIAQQLGEELRARVSSARTPQALWEVMQAHVDTAKRRPPPSTDTHSLPLVLGAAAPAAAGRLLAVGQWLSHQEALQRRQRQSEQDTHDDADGDGPAGAVQGEAGAGLGWALTSKIGRRGGGGCRQGRVGAKLAIVCSSCCWDSRQWTPSQLHACAH